MTPPSGFLRRTATRTFRDRREAGRALAEKLTFYRDKDGVLVFGLARGGVPVAWEKAVGQVYADFHQVSDDEVRELLETPTASAG